jgi:uncharacterized protein (DUF1800 family)
MASLNKRQGLLGKRLAAHLLRRTTYHITKARIESFANKTAEQAVDELFVIPPFVEPKGPINTEDGTTYWLTDGPYTPPSNSTTAQQSVLFWFYNELMNDTSIRHKMAIFYSAIYVSEEEADWRLFNGYRTYQQFATGNLRDLAVRMTLDNRMLRYLNNNVNNKWSPNENYAREFLELFTILKGKQLSEGDYSNYTEHDIQEAAKVLTGFRDSTITNIEPSTGLTIGYAQYSHHHLGNKQFSVHFNHKVILGASSEADMYRELNEFVDMIFDKVETARAFVRRLYLFFVNDKITTEIETDIIEPLALQLWTDNYALENTLKRLLQSVHFFDEDDSSSTDEIIGGKIKSPIELYFSSITLFDGNKMGGLNATPSNFSNYSYRLIIYTLAMMGYPDYATSVEGYPGYFKSPSFSKSWVDTSTLPMRYKMGAALLGGYTIYSIYHSLPFKVDIVKFIKDNFSNQEYAELLLDQIFEIVFPEAQLSGVRRNYFRNKLTGGVSNFNWMFEWQNYIATNDASSVRVVLEDLFEAIVGSPEYQTF